MQKDRIFVMEKVRNTRFINRNKDEMSEWETLERMSFNVFVSFAVLRQKKKKRVFKVYLLFGGSGDMMFGAEMIN